MVGCSIRKCNSRSVKGGTLRFFSFPKKESVANEWLRYCGSKTTTKNGRVCSNHFSSSDYFKPLQHILLNESPPKARTLKPDAIPTLQINQPNCSEIIKNETPETRSTEQVSSLQNVSIDKENTHNVKLEVTNEIEETEVTIEIAETVNSEIEETINSNIEEESDGTITISRAEHKLLKRTVNEHHVLRKNLETIFTPGQIRCLMKSDMRRVKWSEEDIAAAISLRSVSVKAYRHLRGTIGIPLPAFSTLRKWAAKFETKEELLENVVTLIKFKPKS